MQMNMRVAVMVASLGLMSVAHANNLQNPKAAPASSATTSTTSTMNTPSGSLGSTGNTATSSTTDQVLVGGTSSAPSQTGTSQGALSQHDHGHDEDMD